MQWAQYDGASTCHIVHPTWKPLRWQRDMKSKLTCSWYHTVAVGRGRFRSLLFSYGSVDSQVCRLCNSENETIEHIFFNCSLLSETRKDLQICCKTQGLDFTLQNLFTRAPLQRKVEEFLYDLFNEKFKESNDKNNPD